jgi:hypothetical protein
MDVSAQRRFNGRNEFAVNFNDRRECTFNRWKDSLGLFEAAKHSLRSLREPRAFGV